MPRIFIENKIGEKIEIYGPQYEKGLGDSLENFDDFSIVRTSHYPIAYIDDNNILQAVRHKIHRPYLINICR